MSPIQNPETRIGVIGGGAAVVVFLDALLRVGPSGPTVVTVYEPNPAMAVGRPYGEDPDQSLLNRPAIEMTTSHTEPGVFVSWVNGAVWRGELPQIKADARFQPRWLFGRYLQDRFRDRSERLGALGAQVRVRQAAVQDVLPAGTGLSTVTQDGSTEQHDALVLCVGTPAPVDVYGLRGVPGFVEDAYPLPESVDPDASVLILGCGLTAVDIARGLMLRGHRGPVRLASRRGLLPCVRSTAATVQEESRERLIKVVEDTAPEKLRAAALKAMREELTLHGADPAEIELDLRLGEDPATRLRRQLARADSADCWRGVADALLESIAEMLWFKLPAPDRRDFLTRFDTLANTIVNPMPPETAESLLEWIESGRIEVVGGIRDVAGEHDGGFTVTADGGGWHADLVFNAVRPTPYDPQSTPGVLLSRLDTAGLARENPFGGVHIDFATNRVLGSSAGLFALGHPTAGDLYHTNVSSLTGMSVRAEAVVRAIQQSRQV